MPLTPELTQLVLSLPQSDREELFELLGQSLDSELAQAEFIATIERRSHELRTGAVVGVPIEEAFAQAEEVIKRISGNSP